MILEGRTSPDEPLRVTEMAKLKEYVTAVLLSDEVLDARFVKNKKRKKKDKRKLLGRKRQTQ